MGKGTQAGAGGLVDGGAATIFPAPAGGSGRMSWMIVAGCTALALLVRLYYVNTVVIDGPVRGDAVAYFAYARNLVEHGVFSSVPPDAGRAILPDSYRDPGYPFLVALLMRLAGEHGWYPLLLNGQAVLGAATTALALALGRRWTSPWWLAAAGVLMALWPHSVTINSYILTETLAGFLSVLWLLALSLARGRTRATFVAGLLAGASGLVNVVLLPAGPVLAVALWATGKLGRGAAASLLAGSLLLPAAWAGRGMTLDQADAVTSSSSGRASQNLIQGSWPEYHDSWRACIFGDAAACDIQRRIEGEIALLHADPAAGAGAALRRLADDPWKSVEWYVTKPGLFWGWSIRMGAGDIHVYRASASAYQANTFYRATSAVAYGLNPWLFVLAALFCATAAWRWRVVDPAVLSVAVFLLYVTGIYWVFQSEPRYAIPFRSLQLLAAVAMLAFGSAWLRTRASPGRSMASSPR